MYAAKPLKLCVSILSKISFAVLFIVWKKQLVPTEVMCRNLLCTSVLKSSIYPQLKSTLAKIIKCVKHLKLNTLQLVTPGGNNCCQMMYRIKYWFIDLLILSTVCERDKQ